MTSWAGLGLKGLGLGGSGLKLIFHWNAQLLIFLKSLFKWAAEVLISRTTEKREVLSAKGLAFVDRSSERSLMQIKNNSGPSMDSWGTPASILVQWKTYPLKTTCYFLKITLHRKPYLLFQDVLNRWSFQKNRTGIWSFLCYRERWFFYFAKIWSYPLD